MTWTWKDVVPAKPEVPDGLTDEDIKIAVMFSKLSPTAKYHIKHILTGLTSRRRLRRKDDERPADLDDAKR